VSKLSWAHPEFGPIIASSSYDRTVKVWERKSAVNANQSQQKNSNDGSTPSGASNSPWDEIVVFLEAKGTVRDVEFAPHHFGLKLVRYPQCLYFFIYFKFTVVL